jgi:YbbR domain-containing protein
MLGSVLVAIVLWVMVATDKNYDYQITVPIKLVRLAPHRTLYEAIPSEAQVEVRAKGRSLLVLWFYDYEFRLDFPDLRTSRRIDLEDYLDALDLPGALNIEVLGVVEPKTIDLKIDEEVEEKKPISLSGNVVVEDGYTLIGYEFTPDSVVISGPKNLIRQINRISTSTIDFTNRKNSFSEAVRLIDPNPGLIEVSPAGAEVNFDIQRLVERVIYDIPIHVINVPRNLIAESVPPKMSLKIKGGEQIVAAIKSEEIIAEINFLKQYKVDREEYGAEIITPANVNWIESIPQKFRLKVRRK